MPRPSSRELVLDAFEELLTGSAPTAVTLEAVARQAGVSKGGLLYHFASKEALRDALLDRFEQRNDEDIRQAQESECGLITYYLRTPLADVTEKSPYHQSLMAVLRLAVNEPPVREALGATMSAWHAALVEETGDDLTARLIALLGDGLYLHAVMGLDEGPLLDALPEVLSRLRQAGEK